MNHSVSQRLFLSRAATGLAGHTARVTFCAFSPDGSMFVSGSNDKTLGIWDARTGRRRMKLTGARYGIHPGAYYPDGSCVMAVSAEYFKLWCVKTGRLFKDYCLDSFFDCHNRDTSSDSGRINSVPIACSPDGLHIAVGWRCLDIRKAMNFKMTQCIVSHTDWLTCCSFSPDGAFLVSGSKDTTLGVTDVKTGEQRAAFCGHTGGVTCCAFSPDGVSVVSGSSDTTLRVWDTKTGEQRTVLSGHTGAVTCCAYSPDGVRVVSGSEDKTLRIWDAHTGREEDVFHCNAAVSAVAISRCGKHIVCGDDTGALSMLRPEGLTTGLPLIVAAGSAPRFRVWCPICHAGILVTRKVLHSISSLNPENRSLVDCAESALADKQLQSRCPHCGTALRYVPFVVHRRAGQKTDGPFHLKIHKEKRPLLYEKTLSDALGDILKNISPELYELTIKDPRYSEWGVIPDERNWKKQWKKDPLVKFLREQMMGDGEQG